MRALESDAYVFADRFASGIAESISRQTKAGKFIEQVGTGGGRIEHQVYSARKYSNGKSLSLVGAGQGSESDEELDQTLDAIDRVYKKLLKGY